MTLQGEAGGSPREVVLGRNSRVWQAAAANPRIAERFRVAIGHAELRQFQFTANDRVWVFAYSRLPSENSALIEMLAAARVREVIYVSTASAVVCQLSRCYEYPRVKQQAELEASRRLAARVLVLGVVYTRPEDLPSGLVVCTPQAAIDEFMLAPHWPDRNGDSKYLFAAMTLPFRTRLEQLVYRAYGAVLWSVRRWPCVLRPLDLVLRFAGIRWYGYVYLSNLLWTATRS